MASKAKTKNTTRPARWLRPTLTSIAVALFWSAQHEPDVLAANSIAAWLLTTLALCLLCRAALALVGPVSMLFLLASLRLRPPGAGTGS